MGMGFWYSYDHSQAEANLDRKERGDINEIRPSKGCPTLGNVEGGRQIISAPR